MEDADIPRGKAEEFKTAAPKTHKLLMSLGVTQLPAGAPDSQGRPSPHTSV